MSSIFNILKEDSVMNHSDITSYRNLYELRQSFIRSGGHSDTIADTFNYLETPANMYFQIFFHFNTGFGLLNLGDQYIDKSVDLRTTQLNGINTATNYLWNNREFQRLQLLGDFVTLLSNINIWSPWYFQSIEGLTEAMTRTEYTGKFAIADEPQSITIKCMEDAYDNRIATLLDLYKTICYSKTLHKEILPANLRKFDMSIYIVNTPINRVHYREDNTSVSVRQPSYQEWKNGSSKIFASSKLIEFQGCEIDANSSYSGYGEVKNEEAFMMKHDIKITFTNVVEQRYNEFLDRIISDYVFEDQDGDVRNSTSNPWKDYSEGTDKADKASETLLKSISIGSQIDPMEDPDLYEMWRQQIEIDERDLNEVSLNSSKLKTASANLKPSSEGTSHDAQKFSLDNIGTNIVSGATSSGGAPHDAQKFSLDNIGTNIVKGASSAIKSKVQSTINKYVFGNLYWGSMLTPSINNVGTKFGENLVNQTMGKTVDKVENQVKGTIQKANASVINGLGKLFNGGSLTTSLGWNKS